MRRFKILAAITAGILLATASLAGALTATAVPSGYTGIGDPTTNTAFDTYGGDRVLPLMTVGAAYSETLTGPQFGSTTNWCWSVDTGELPDGITMSTPGNGAAPSATFSGTPEAGDFYFTLKVGDCNNETNYYLDFAIILESSKSPTTTTLTVPEVAPNGAIVLSATVVGNPVVTGPPTGIVRFRDQNDVLLDSGTLTAGSTTVTVAIDPADAGSDLEVTAVYVGDDDYQGSVSDELDIVVYVPIAAGSVQWNGTAVTDATVRLWRVSDGVLIDEDGTDSSGEFELDPGAITDLADAEVAYYVEVTFADGEVLYFQEGAINVTDVGDAETTGPLDWTESLLVDRNSSPNWDDDGLATPREGSVYTDGVSATSRNTVTYSITDGDLPAGLTLDPNTGAITGTPDECSRQGQTPFPFRGMAQPSCDYDFTITADNGYGTVDERFVGTLLPDGVPPTWEDDELDAFQVGVAVDGGVLAVGDPTIVYSVTAGALPAGVILWPSAGILTGTPTVEGPYELTITAANDYGSITVVFEGVVAAAPDLGLRLDFGPGTTIEDASSTISAEGLQVGSTYTLTMFSTPRVLYTGTVGGSGGFSWIVSLPADTPPGSHKLVLTGIAADGTPMSATAWFSLGTNGKILAISYTGPIGGLAATGSDPTSGLLAGGMLLLLGLGLVAVRRRRAAEA